MKKRKSINTHNRKWSHLVAHKRPKPKAKEVIQIRFYGHAETGYCVCPGCHCTFEREYQAYCDRCGQKLAWNLFSRGNVTLVKRIPCTIRKTEEINKEIELTSS